MTMADGWARAREVRTAAHASLTESAWPFRLLPRLALQGSSRSAAQLSLPLPWTPVPFSFQVLAVLVTGRRLGARGDC